MRLNPSSWIHHVDSLGSLYKRPLGLTEKSFYWDSVFAHTADTLRHAEFEVDSTLFNGVIDFSNISKSWINLKKKYPLLGAEVEEEEDESSVFFVVRPENLQKSLPGEVTLLNVTSSQDAYRLVKRLIAQKEGLSNKLLGRVIILKRDDIPNRFHMVTQVAHLITDGMANITIMKSLLHQLCQNPADLNPPSSDLTTNLALSVSSEDLSPQRLFNTARKRWRKAVAAIILARRNSTLVGGHSLPRKVSQMTPHNPADSKHISYSFDPETSNLIIKKCRQHNLTFGNVYPIIGQIAVTRVLLRRYLRGEIAEEEWQWRKTQPMFSAGPLNLRPMLDKEWIDAGGLTNVCVSVGFYFLYLPYMPLGRASNIQPGMDMPSFDSLLSRKRFFLRSNNMKAQAIRSFKHPLFMDISQLSAPARIQRNRNIAVARRKGLSPSQDVTTRLLTPQEQASNGVVFCNGGSSFGNVDKLLPLEYPLNRMGSPPSLHLISSGAVLQCRPTELYLGASTSRNCLNIEIYWDCNVFSEDLIEEWLDEVKMAVEFYLGNGPNFHGKL